MKTIFGELVNLLAASILVVCLIMAGYLIFANFYHYNDLRYNYVLNDEDKKTVERYTDRVNGTISKIDKLNFDRFGTDDKKLYYLNIQAALSKCATVLKNSNFISGIDKVNSSTNYSLYNDFSGNVHSKCLSLEFSNIKSYLDKYGYKDEQINQYVAANSEIIDSIYKSNNTVLSLLMSNSTYSYTTLETKMTLYNSQEVIYKQLAFNYDKASILVDRLTDRLVEVSEGGN